MPTINSENINAFKVLYEPGDYKVIAKKIGKTSATVSVAIQREAASDEIIEALNNFYKERALERISKSKTDQKLLQKMVDILN